MNNTNPFQSQNPFGTANTGNRATLAPLTLATHLSPLGHGRQAVIVSEEAAPEITFRRS